MQGDCKTGDTHASGLEATARTGNYSDAVSEPHGLQIAMALERRSTSLQRSWPE
jgi:hypothetical protein